jgi:hypothetical protein
MMAWHLVRTLQRSRCLAGRGSQQPFLMFVGNHKSSPRICADLAIFIDNPGRTPLLSTCRVFPLAIDVPRVESDARLASLGSAARAKSAVHDARRKAFFPAQTTAAPVRFLTTGCRPLRLKQPSVTCRSTASLLKRQLHTFARCWHGCCYSKAAIAVKDERCSF